MKTKRFLSCLLLAVLLLVPLSISARAAEYSDLPASHWAHDDMRYAAWLGIVNGVGGDQIAPSAPLSWGQFLTMLTRVFAPRSYQSAVNRGLPWDQAGLLAAQDAGLLPEDMPVGALDSSITRLEVAVLLNQALSEDAVISGIRWGGSAEEKLTDFYLIDPACREAVSRMVSLGIIQGKADGTFGGDDPLQRCDGSVLLLRAVKLVDAALSGTPTEVGLLFVDEAGQPVGNVFVSAWVGSSLYALSDNSLPAGYEYDYSDSSFSYPISSIQNQYVVTLHAMSELERQEADFWDRFYRGEVSYEEYYLQDFLLKEQGENPRKYMLLFGSQDKRRFDNQQEAAAAMTTVTVPVWHLSNGKKVSATVTLTVHAALAEDVKEIFTEIYNDPEQFPIYDVGGYAWRGDSATGEHNCGTAVDLNSNENYQVRDGAALAGSHWLPGQDPYSIPENGSVVRIFAEHGWSWGGDAWAWDTDPAEGYHDFMHFSYMGG